LFFFLAFFSLPLFSASYCYIGVDADRCNPRIPNRIQACGNCDADSDNEWCNTIDCATTGKICLNGTCHNSINCADADNDGYGAIGSTGCAQSGVDCNNNNAAIHPNAAEICGNGIDEDCAGGDQLCSTNIIISVLQPISSEFLIKDNINFSASAIGGSYPYKYAWQSNKDGILYSGLTNNFATSNLSAGTHTINLTVTDSLGATKQQTLNLTVYNANTLFAAINTPYNGEEFPLGNLIYFNSSLAGAISPANYAWASDRDGVISASDHFSISTLSLGDHKITLTVTDDAAKTFVKSINIKIISGLVLKIYQPTPGAYEQGINIFFNAGVNGGASPYAFSWSSNKDGKIDGSVDKDRSGKSSGREIGGGIIKNDLSLGTHLITVVATDAAGATASESVTIEIVEPLCLDDDKDGYGKTSGLNCLSAGIDCDDANPNINPAATEICGNTIDENCNYNTTDCPVTLTVLSPAGNGQTFVWGSKLSIKIKGAPITSASMNIYNSANAPVKYILLYNDGTHNDGAANDDIWGADLQLVFPNGNYHLNATVNALPHNNIINFNISDTPTCTTIVNNGNSADKLDIVFIADKYTSSEIPNFIAKVQAAYGYLFGIVPFNAQNSKINIHRVDSPMNLGCAGWSTHQPDCNASNISPIASLCPGDRTIVMVDGNFRSYAYKGGYAIVAANDSNFKGVVVHEFGHSLGQLDDEYVDSVVPDRGATIVNLSVNCDTSSVCTKWRTPQTAQGALLSGTGCYTGCDYRNTYYRSISNGIMRNHTVTDFGVININQINKLFNSYR